jgi:hypothetical protein
LIHVHLVRKTAATAFGADDGEWMTKREKKLAANLQPGALLCLALTSSVCAACASEPTPADLRSVVVAEMAKVADQSPESFGDVTVVSKTSRGENVAFAIEIPRGRSRYEGEVLYRPEWRGYKPLRVSLHVKQSTRALDVPAQAMSVWRTLNGKYQIFVHSAAPLESLSGLETRPLVLALVDEHLEPIPYPVAGFSGDVDPAVKGLELTALAGVAIGLSGPVPDIVTGVAQFLAAGGVRGPTIQIHNVAADYEKAFMADPQRVAIVPTAMARKLGFERFADLTQVTIR